jgi:hypothetical protein
MAPLSPTEQGGLVVMVLVYVRNILTRVEMVSFLVIWGQFSTTARARLRFPNWGQANFFNFFSLFRFAWLNICINTYKQKYCTPSSLRTGRDSRTILREDLFKN